MGIWARIRDAAGNKLAIDPTFGAARVCVKPDEYVFGGRVLGHYSIAGASGVINANTASTYTGFSARWTDPSVIAIVKRVRFQVQILTAITLAGTQPLLDLTIVRGFTTNFAGNFSPLALSSASGRARSSMAPSTASMGITTGTGGMIGATLTADVQQVAISGFPLSAFTADQTHAPISLFDCSQLGQHPLIFGANEGFVMRMNEGGAGWGSTGTWQLVVMVDWLEAASY